ncbi:hypothetical protein FOA52_013302 [Chlamydomonas sp. UWO 241]|nr:hypothetical protein FOA52_013302 [Chlamydomonas sp. UWO 241]
MQPPGDGTNGDHAVPPCGNTYVDNINKGAIMRKITASVQKQKAKQLASSGALPSDPPTAANLATTTSQTASALGGGEAPPPPDGGQAGTSATPSDNAHVLRFGGTHADEQVAHPGLPVPLYTPAPHPMAASVQFPTSRPCRVRVRPRPACAADHHLLGHREMNQEMNQEIAEAFRQMQLKTSSE